MAAEEKNRINLRFDPPEMQLVRDRAERLGLSVQAYVHGVVMSEINEIQRAFVTSTRRTIEEYADAFPSPEDDRAARAPGREREHAAAREEQSTDPAGGQAA